VFSVNNVMAIRQAVEKGVGIAMLPDYLVNPNSKLVTVLTDYEVPGFDCFFVYPEEMRDSARVTVFRDFLVANARRWSF
jgi:DNA-binding transcriptional LysR family regulator